MPLPGTPPTPPPSMADIMVEAQAKMASGEMPTLQSPFSVDTETAAPAGETTPPAMTTPPASPPSQDDAARLAVQKQMEESAAARLQRERAEFEASRAAYEAEKQGWSQQYAQQQDALRQAQELAIWKQQQQQMALADPVEYLKTIGLTQEQQLAAAKALWERAEGEAAPPQAREGLAIIKLQQELAAIKQAHRQQEIALRQYQYTQEIESNIGSLLPNLKYVTHVKQTDHNRYMQERNRSMLELGQKNQRLPTADEIARDIENRLQHEATFWSKMASPSAVPTPVTTQNLAIEGKAAPLNGLTTAPPQRQTEALPESGLARLHAAVAEGLAKFPGPK